MENEGDSLSSKSSGYNPLHQYVAVFTGLLIMVCWGMHTGWPSPSLPLLLNQNSTISATNSDGSRIVVALLISQPFGCLIGFLLVDRIGRKTCILIGSPLICLSWLLIAFATNVFTIIFARTLSGCAGGIIFTSLPIYIGEIANQRIRGLLGCSIQMACKLGGLLINVIGLHFTISTTAFISAAIPIIHFVTFYWMPESPYFFILHKKNQKAAASLKRFTNAKDVNSEISELSAMVLTNSEPSEKLLYLFTKKVNRRAIGAILGIKCVEQFSGFYVINFYCLTIFNEAGGTITGSTQTLIYLGTQLIVSTIGCALVDRIGRRPLLIVSISGAGCSLAIEAVYFYLKYKTSTNMSSFGFLPLVTLLVYTSSYSIGLGIIPTLLLGELFPIRTKAFGSGFGISCFAIFAAIVSTLFQILKDNYGMHVPFAIFAMCCAGGLVFIMYCIPETKKRTLEEIQLNWTNNDHCKIDRHNDANNQG